MVPPIRSIARSTWSRRRARVQGRLPGQHGAHRQRPLSLRRGSGRLPGARHRRLRRSRPGSTRRDASSSPTISPPWSASVKVGRYPFGITLSPRRPQAVRDARRRVPVHAPSAGETPTGDRQPRLPALLSGRRLSRARRATIARSRSRRSTRAICRTACAIPTASAAAMSRATGSTRCPGSAARTRRSPLRSTSSTSARRRVLDAREIVKTGPLRRAARERDRRLQRQPSERGRRQARRRFTSPTATTTASRCSTRGPTRNATASACRCCAARIASLKGVQPVGLALSPDGELSVRRGGRRQRRRRRQAQTGCTAISSATSRLAGGRAACSVSADGKSLYVANARGRGAGPNPVGESRSPKFTVLGTVNIIPTPIGAAAGGVTRRASIPTTALPTSNARRWRCAASRFGRRRDSDNPDPESGREAERADQARHLHQQGECDARPDARRHHDDAPRRAGGRRAELLARLRCEPEPSRAGAALCLQRQLLPRAVGVVGRPSLADRAVHGRVRGDALAGVLRRRAPGLGRRSGGLQGLSRPASASPTPTRRRSRTTTTSTAASTCT